MIIHRPESDGDGISLDGDRLTLWAGGEELISSQLSREMTEMSLDEMLETHEIPNLFPSFEFALSEELIVWDLEIDTSMSARGAILGELCVIGGTGEIGESGLWEAQRARGAAFHFSARELALRPWLNSEEVSGEGWAFSLPLFVAVHQDQILRKRTAAAIEAFIYSLQAQREINLPYRRRVTNSFSHRDPIWSEDTPAIWKAG